MTASLPGLDASRETLSELVYENYPSIAANILCPLLELSRVARIACGGDSDKFLIMLAVAVRTMEHPTFGTYSQAQLMSGEVQTLPSLGINIQSIADSVGMPKETVRRKVGELVNAGWIAREGSDLRYTCEGYRQLAGVRGAVERLAVRYFEMVARLLRTREPGSSDRAF